jgi:fatty-acyl-CoA synthase
VNLAKRLIGYYEKSPLRPAIHFQIAGKPDETITYRDLIDGAMGYVHVFRENKVDPGDVVLLILQHSLDMAYAYFAAILYGAVPSIMPFLTEKLLAERYRADLEALLEVTKPRVVVTYKEFDHEVTAAIGSRKDEIRIIISGDKVGSAPIDYSFMSGLLRSPSDVVLLQHSSGTTGLQKGVALSHQAVINQLETYSEAICLNDQDVIVSWLPLYHDMGLIACWLLPIIKGIPLVLMSPFDWVKAPYRLFQAVSKYRGTLSWLPNFAFNFCVHKVRDRYLEGVDLSTWRSIINCSEPMRWDSMNAFHGRFAQYGLKRNTLTTCYAMAENVFAVTQGKLNSPLVYEDVDQEKLQSLKIADISLDGKASVRMLGAGEAIKNTHVKIVDENGGNLPERYVGEILLQGDCMLTGYFNRPEITEAAFSDGWYRSGDFGYLVGKELFITGRKKDLIIVGGKNIYPQDLETLVYEVEGVHPGRASAFGVFNDENGTEDVIIVAEVDTDDESERKKIGEEIRIAVSRGSAVALRDIYIVGKHWLVKTSSGKVARSANRDKYLLEVKNR